MEKDRNPYELGSDASMGNAILGDVPGVGTLQIVRDADGKFIETVGTWRLAGDETHDTRALEDSLTNGSTVTYNGKLDDPAYPDVVNVETTVRITAVRPYVFDQAEYLDHNENKVLFRFELEGDLPYKA